jgi:hypothetical protein
MKFHLVSSHKWTKSFASHQYRRYLCVPCRPERLATDKHSGLLQRFLYYGRREFYNILPHTIKIFAVVFSCNWLFWGRELFQIYFIIHFFRPTTCFINKGWFKRELILLRTRTNYIQEINGTAYLFYYYFS